MKLPPRLSLRVLRCTLQAAARLRLRFCRLSKPAQAGLEPQAPAPRGLNLLGAARRGVRSPPRWPVTSRPNLQQVTQAAQGHECHAGMQKFFTQPVHHDLNGFVLHIQLTRKHQFKQLFF